MSEFDMSEGPKALPWESRFESQINAFFDDAIQRVPGFVDKNLRSFRKVMGRNLAPTTGVGDVLIGVRNLASGVSSAVGGPKFETTTFTHDKLVEAFEREVVSPKELETLLSRLFAEFEEDLWRKAERAAPEGAADGIHEARERVVAMMEQEIAHDPKLAQALRTGVKIGVPATLGYVLFGQLGTGPSFGDAAGEIYKRNLDLYHKVLLRFGGVEVPTWVGAVGWAGSVLGTLAAGGLVEFGLNNIRDLKGSYIRQLNSARHILLHGHDPGDEDGKGILHIVRGFERRVENVPELAKNILEGADEATEPQKEKK